MRIPLLIAPAALAITAGCASMGHAVQGYPEVAYQCEDGRWFAAVLTPSRAMVRLPNGRRYHLTGQGDADRAAYSDGRVRLAARRGAAVLVTPQERYDRCWMTDA